MVFIGLTAGVIPFIPNTAHAYSSCSSDGNECVNYTVNGLNVQIWDVTAYGDFRNTRTWDNGHYNGQIQTDWTYWNYNLPYGDNWTWYVEDCHSGWFSSSCTQWAGFNITVY
jgi:hypothetical protein